MIATCETIWKWPLVAGIVRVNPQEEHEYGYEQSNVMRDKCCKGAVHKE
jgi:hypothetical protein